MIRLVKFIFKIFGTVEGMFFTGEKINNIKSMCFLEYANYLNDIKSINKAIIYYNKAISANPANYYAYGSIAAAFFKKKNFDQALKYCNKANAIKPGISVQILTYVIYDILGQTILAKEIFQHVLKYYKNDLIAAFDRLSYTYYQVNLYEKAEYYSKEALKINPNVASLHYNLANIYFAQARFSEAKEEFRKVLELTNNKRYRRYSIQSIERIEKVSG
jgi:tetratricopeptide (TPR) repeat protein